MAAESKKPGFYGTDSETYYLTPSGRTWIVGSDDTGPDPVEIASVPEGANSVDDLLTPDEAIGHLRRVEAEGGEMLIEGN